MDAQSSSQTHKVQNGTQHFSLQTWPIFWVSSNKEYFHYSYNWPIQTPNAKWSFKNVNLTMLFLYFESFGSCLLCKLHYKVPSFWAWCIRPFIIWTLTTYQSSVTSPSLPSHSVLQLYWIFSCPLSKPKILASKPEVSNRLFCEMEITGNLQLQKKLVSILVIFFSHTPHPNHQQISLALPSKYYKSRIQPLLSTTTNLIQASSFLAWITAIVSLLVSLPQICCLLRIQEVTWSALKINHVIPLFKTFQ